MSGILYVVGTPIGNLSDLSPRAVETLQSCDFIAAEDTRVTRKLLNHFGISTPTVSYHEHNSRTAGEKILARLLAGESCALVTDAGMPAISDPGEALVALAHEHGVRVEAVPGPTAFATAVAVSGLPSGRFTFEGFLSVQKAERCAHLQSLVSETRTMVFYEAPHRLARTLQDLLEAFGDRKVALVKELTKLHEAVERTTLSAAAAKYAEQQVKGEYVLVIHGADAPDKASWSLEEAVAFAEREIQAGASKTEAAKAAAAKSGLKKGDIYKALTQ